MSVHRDTEPDPPAEGFAERWSRRKQEVGREDTQRPVQTQLPETEAATEPVPALTDDDMPPVESLDERSDYAAFLSPGISEQLRAQALRKLFKLPGMHLPDGLDDYDDDFTQFTELGKTITHEMQRMLNRQLAADEHIQNAEVQASEQTTAESTVTSEDIPAEDEQQAQARATPAQAGDDETSDRQG